MFRDTFARDLNEKAFSANIQALLAAKLHAQMGADLRMALPQSDRDMVEWLMQDLDRHTLLAFSMYGALALLVPLTEGRDTRHWSFSLALPHEPTDWAVVARGVAQLRQRDPLIPNQEIGDLARQVAARDYSQDNIQEWAKRLSQLPFSDEE
jgi:hypothetical protein